ncbi:MAG TPA: polyprenyl synthetase family protein [Gemmatimonadaceae bacterium]|nr:polyprenyl synthetase family protein [Gemmatimonadaceae bacterium]
MTTASRSAPGGASGALADIQSPVRTALDGVPQEMRRIVAAEEGLVNEVAGHLMMMRGKMFRPTLVLLASAVDGRPEPIALSYAAVAELIHLGTLVHDDSVDHSALRRGMPTVNSAFSHQVSVIMGDYIYVRAIGELVRLGDLDVLRVVVRASNEMTLGEMRQLAAIDALSFSEAAYTRLIGAKTASLLSASCEVGALCGASRWREQLARYGERLGLAFQIADDLLDYTGSAETTGKPVGLDLREHKVTLPLIAALPGMSPAARGCVDRLFAATTPTDQEIAEVVAVVTEHGGLDYARTRGEQYAQQAEEALAELPDSPARAALGDAIGYVMDRRW